MAASTTPLTALPPTHRLADGPSRNFQLLQRRVVAKLKNGERLRIGIVGGSISAMPNAYGDHLVEWLNRNWPARDGSQHEVINMAIPGSESGVASICLGSFFRYSPSRDAEPPIDLLLVEFAYNDNGILPGSEGETDFTISRTSNYERIFRSALSWPIPAMVIELVSYSGDVRRPPLRNSFLSSSGYSHALVAQHYSVPVIDFAQTMYSWPQLDDLAGFYVDKGIHLAAGTHPHGELDRARADPATLDRNQRLVFGHRPFQGASRQQRPELASRRGVERAALRSDARGAVSGCAAVAPSPGPLAVRADATVGVPVESDQPYKGGTRELCRGAGRVGDDDRPIRRRKDSK